MFLSVGGAARTRLENRVQVVDKPTHLARDAQEGRFLSQAPRLDPRHGPRAWDATADDLRELSQRAGQAAGSVSDDHQAENIDERHQARGPLRGSHLGSSKAVVARASHQDDRGRSRRGHEMRPRVVRHPRVLDEMSKLALPCSPVRTQPPERPRLAGAVLHDRKLIHRVGGRHAALWSDGPGWCCGRDGGSSRCRSGRRRRWPRDPRITCIVHGHAPLILRCTYVVSDTASLAEKDDRSNTMRNRMTESEIWCQRDTSSTVTVCADVCGCFQ